MATSPAAVRDALTTTVLEPYRLGLADVSITRWTCVFRSDRLEQAFRQHVYEEQIRPVLTRIILLLMAVLIVFVGVDRLVVPDVWEVAAQVRLGLLLPMWVGWFLVSRHVDLRPEWVTWGGLLATSAVVALFLYIAAVAEPPGSWLYLLYIVSFTMAGPGIGRWGLTPSSIFNVGVASASVAVAVAIDLATPVLTMMIVGHAVGAGFGLLLGTLIESSARRTFVQQRVIELEQARSDRLLHNVLPDSIAQRLKGGERHVADDYDDATVLFCDLVGFTPLAGDLTASQVVSLLDGLFSGFDDLVERSGLEKIKTVGDAYVVAGGVPEPRADHVVATADLALDLLDAVRRYRDAGGVGLRLRVGIHRGPLVAGVIGKRRFVYDLWGDTVNVASRMEGLSEPDRILVTDAVVTELRRAGYVLEPRGDVEVKGRGMLTAWWLTGRPPEPDGASRVSAPTEAR